MRLRRWRWSLRWQIAVSVACAVVLTAVALGVFAFRGEQQRAKHEFVNASTSRVEADARTLADLARTGGEKMVRRVVTDRSRERLTIGYAAVARSDGRVASVCDPGSCVLPLDDAIRAAVVSGEREIAWRPLANGDVLVVAEPVRGTGLSLVVTFDYAATTHQLAELRRSLVVLGFAAAGLAALLGIGIGFVLGRPIREVAAAARGLDTRGSEAAQPVVVRPRGGREVRDLAMDFNLMAERLERSQSLQRRFVADVSHELRNPLAAMLASVAAASESDEGRDDPAVRREALALLSSQTVRLHELVEDLLRLSAIDAGRVELQLEDVDLMRLCRVVADEVGVPVELRSDGAVTIRSDVSRLQVILRNLLVNAARHGVPPVRVVLASAGDVIEVRVSDHGPGIDAELAGRVFDRFARGRAATSAGTGLGLALARENARLLGGDLVLVEPATATFVVRWPASATTS